MGKKGVAWGGDTFNTCLPLIRDTKSISKNPSENFLFLLNGKKSTITSAYSKG